MSLGRSCVCRVMKNLRVITLLVVLFVGCHTARVQHRKGNATTPSRAEAFAGTYYRAFPLGYVQLQLRPDDTYMAEWQGCLGKTGESHGKWNVEGSRITFSPSSETAVLPRLRSLEILKFESDWVFPDTDGGYREIYEEVGVSAGTCFVPDKRFK